MSIIVRWDTHLPDTIRFELNAGWRWRDYEAGITAFNQLIQAVNHPVCVLVHLANDAAFAISPLVQARRDLNNPERIQAIVVNPGQRQSRAMLDMFVRAYQDLGEPIEVLAKTPEAFAPGLGGQPMYLPV